MINHRTIISYYRNICKYSQSSMPGNYELGSRGILTHRVPPIYIWRRSSMTRCNVLFTPHPRSNNKLCSLYSRGLYFSGQEKHLLQNDCLPIRRRSVHSRNDQCTRRCIAGRIERLLFFRQRAKRSQVIIDIQTYGRPSLAAVCSLSLSR